MGRVGSGPQQSLDGAALVHGPVSLSSILYRQFEVEDAPSSRRSVTTWAAPNSRASFWRG
jgi:hypothetical protein